MRNFLEQNIPLLYLLVIAVGVALLFAVSESNQSHYERGVKDAETEYKRDLMITRPI